jgi:hypothetical protein
VSQAASCASKREGSVPAYEKSCFFHRCEESSFHGCAALRKRPAGSRPAHGLLKAFDPICRIVNQRGPASAECAPATSTSGGPQPGRRPGNESVFSRHPTPSAGPRRRPGRRSGPRPLRLRVRARTTSTPPPRPRRRERIQTPSLSTERPAPRAALLRSAHSTTRTSPAGALPPPSTRDDGRDCPGRAARAGALVAVPRQPTAVSVTGPGAPGAAAAARRAAGRSRRRTAPVWGAPAPSRRDGARRGASSEGSGPAAMAALAAFAADGDRNAELSNANKSFADHRVTGEPPCSSP